MIKEWNIKQIAIVALLLAAGLLSFFVVGSVTSSPSFHAESIADLEEKQSTAMGLAGATAAASTAVSLIPGDGASPIAEKLADLSAAFLAVLCAILLEKYLLTVTCYVAFHFLVPALCALLIAYMFLGREGLRTLAVKLAIFSVALVLAIPASVQLSKVIEDTYQTSIQAAIDSAQEAADAVEDAAADAEETDAGAEEGGFFSGLLDTVTGSIAGVASSVTEKLGGMLNRFMEALAVMLVTTCLIPILVFVFFLWLVKLLFSVELPVSFKSARQGVRHTVFAGSGHKNGGGQ